LNKKYSIANWGKRAIPENLALNLKKKNNNERVIDDDDDQMSNYVLDELRLVNKIVCIKTKFIFFFSFFRNCFENDYDNYSNLTNTR
jgi:hypothetical protein